MDGQGTVWMVPSAPLIILPVSFTRPAPGLSPFHFNNFPASDPVPSKMIPERRRSRTLNVDHMSQCLVVFNLCIYNRRRKYDIEDLR